MQVSSTRRACGRRCAGVHPPLGVDSARSALRYPAKRAVTSAVPCMCVVRRYGYRSPTADYGICTVACMRARATPPQRVHARAKHSPSTVLSIWPVRDARATLPLDQCAHDALPLGWASLLACLGSVSLHSPSAATRGRAPTPQARACRTPPLRLCFRPA